MSKQKNENAKVEIVSIADMQKEIDSYKVRHLNLINQSTDFSIQDEASKVVCISLIREMNSLLDDYKRRKDKVVKPLKDHAKFLESIVAPKEKELKNLLGEAKKFTGLRGQLAKYETEQAELRRKEEEKLRAEQQKKYEKEIKKAEKKGEIAPPPPPPAKVEVSKDEGVSYRNEFDFQVIDVKLIPSEYLIPNDKKIKKVINAGVENIPGLRIFSIKVPIVKESNLEDL